jgi:site-specific recombinase XerD
MNLIFKDPKTLQRMHEGPLGPYMDSYAADMYKQGYARPSAQVQIRLVADFSRWLAKHRITPQGITIEHSQRYLRFRARHQHSQRSDRAALKRLLNLLLRQGVIPEPPLPAASPADRLRDEFGLYLRQERALASSTVRYYLSFVSEFLAERFGTGPVDLSMLCATDVTGFVRRRAASMKSRWVQLMTTALRSFLRFARYRGDLRTDLAACVPSVSNYSLSTIPRALPPEQTKRVLASCNRKAAVGRRDYAILLLLARLGLRAGEIVTLHLEDIDWQNGLITVCGKGGRNSQLPVPVEVGEGIADYLRRARPKAASRCVFLRSKAPITSFSGPQAIASVVRQALARAGIHSPRKGAHQFRHSLATQMLRQGASLAEIGELLRHRSPQTTTIYAKVDLATLRTLALPWPGGVR